MERVQYQQEQMLPELKDLVEKNLFTEREIKQIIKQRTAFETALVRRVAKKADFIRYISYEMDLETLRRKRIQRLDLPKSPATISDYAFVRRQFHIFERALKRFKSDTSLWVQYIQVAKREGARALVGRITARALQLHPNNTSFYVLAASHELDNLSPSAARALLQRGIRVNPESVDMWKEYIKMELGFIESLRRRWDVLGIKISSDTGNKGKQKAMDVDDSASCFMEVDGEPIEDKATVKPAPESKIAYEEDSDDGVEGAEARRQIMEGAIVKSVVLSAAQALPKIELFEAIKTVITEYPSPTRLQSSLLECVYDVLEKTLPRDPKSMEMRAHRHLGSDTKAAELVESLRLANEEMLDTIGNSSDEGLLAVYAAFVEKWYTQLDDADLKTYLISSLQGLVQRNGTSPSLLATHIRLLMHTSSPAKIRRTAQKYTTKVPGSSRVWLARLVAEKGIGAGDGSQGSGGGGGSAAWNVWAEARKRVQGSEDEVKSVWLWGVADEGNDYGARKRTCEELLRESLQASALQHVHEELLMNYVTVLEEECSVPESGQTSDQDRGWSKWLHSIRHMARTYLTTGRVWQRTFASAAGMGDKATDEKGRMLEQVYEFWRKRDELEATVAWAGWLLGHGKGREATAVVVAGRKWVSEEKLGELEKRWTAVLAATERGDS